MHVSIAALPLVFIITALIWIAINCFYAAQSALKTIRDLAAHSVRGRSGFDPIRKEMPGLNLFASGIITGV